MYSNLSIYFEELVRADNEALQKMENGLKAEVGSKAARNAAKNPRKPKAQKNLQKQLEDQQNSAIETGAQAG